jgi:hypothetical protein
MRSIWTSVVRREFLMAGIALPLLGKTLPRATNCILIKLTGGASQLDTWDMKPDAPREIRGPFRPIPTNVPGIRISEIFPRLARHADKFAIVPSVYHDANAAHETMAVYGSPTWDAHGWKPFSTFADYRDTVGPAFDLSFSSLLEDLTRRGLLDTTLVVAMGEFGRSPKINPSGGRDHWPRCSTVLMAGGGIEGGQIYGSSDRFGAEPRDNPVSAKGIHQALCISI